VDVERTPTPGGRDVHRLESIFKTVNAIASKKYDTTIEHMLAQAVLSEIDVAKHERGDGNPQGMATSLRAFAIPNSLRLQMLELAQNLPQHGATK
jgi:hypothetical protein